MTKFSLGNKYAAKLSNEDVYTIRQRYAQGGVTQLQLALDYGVSLNTIRYAIKGVTHQNVPQVETEDQLFDKIQQSQALLLQRLETEVDPEPEPDSAPDPLAIMLSAAEPLEVSLQRIRDRDAAEHRAKLESLQALRQPASEAGGEPTHPQTDEAQK